MKKTLTLIVLLVATALTGGAQFSHTKQTLSVYQYPDFLNASPVSVAVANNQVTVKNVSGQAIKYAEIEVEFPSTHLANLRLYIGSKHYLAPSIHGEDAAQPLRPNETRTLDLNLPEKIRLAIVRPIIALFKGNVGWIVGYPVHRDALNSAHWQVDEDFQSSLRLPQSRFIPATFRREDPSTGTCYRFEGSMTVACGASGCSANVFTIRRALDGFKQKPRNFTCGGSVDCGSFTGDDTDLNQPCLGPDIE